MSSFRLFRHIEIVRSSFGCTTRSSQASAATVAETATGFGCSLRGSEGDGNDDAMAVPGGVLACLLDIDELAGFFCEL